MDNVTHSLVGLVTAEEWLRVREKKKPVSLHFRRTAWLVSIAANNLPDIDFTYTGVIPGKLGYLLHHRGHTHTFVGGMLLSVVLAFVVGIALRIFKCDLSKEEKRFLVGLSLLGGALHILFDSFNSYGVHPFWPFDNRWYYGDCLFIIEPWLLLSLSIPSFYILRHRVARGLILVVVLGLFGLTWVSKLVPISIILALVGFAGLLFWMGTRTRAPSRLSGAVSLAVIAVFGISGSWTKFRFEKYRARVFPQFQTQDTVLSPLPANPFCWMALSLETDEKETTLVTRRAGVAGFAPLVSTRLCETLRPTEDMNRYEAVPVPSNEMVHWLGQVSVSLTELSTVAKNHCAFSAFLRFARVPFVSRTKRNLWATDLRFDWRSSRNFTTIVFEDRAEVCPPSIPPWIPPRESILKRHAPIEQSARGRPK